MAELTREQLIEEAKLKIAIAECHPNSGMARVECELFKIALASLEAEPVAYIFKHPAGKLFWALTDESNNHNSGAENRVGWYRAEAERRHASG